MTNSQNFIVEHLENLFDKIENIRLKYEFKQTTSTHIVEVLPFDVYEESSAYLLLEIEIQNAFEEFFGNSEEILFVSEGSLNRVTSPSFVLGGSKFETENSVKTKDFQFSLELDGQSSFSSGINTSYALAA